MNKLSDITKQIINRPTQLGSSGGVLTNIAKWAMWTKYASIASFTIAIVAIVTINAVGGGLSRLRDYQSAGAANDANSGISTYATNVSDAASIISFTFSNATGSVSSDGRSVTVDIQSPDSGGIATGRHTMNITTNSVAGYTVTVEGSGGSTALSPVDFGGATTNNHLINPVAGTLGSPSVLGSNTWGMAIPGHSSYSAESAYTAGLPVASGGTNGGVENAANQATLQTATFGQIPTKTNAEIVLESNQASGPLHDGAAADTQNIYYGANVEPTLQAGEYSTTITYTATVKLPAAPTNLSVSPNSYELGSGDSNTVTISADSGLTSTYKVWIDLNNSKTNTPDSGEECTNLNVLSDTQLTCNLPTDDSITVDTPYTIYVQTQASTPTPITNAFTYTKSSICRNADPDSDCQVDIDENMIPISYDDTMDTWQIVTDGDIASTPGSWYDYDDKQWANAVTLRNDYSGGAICTYTNGVNGIDYRDTPRCDSYAGGKIYTPLEYAKAIQRGEIDSDVAALFIDDELSMSNGRGGIILGYWVYIPRYAYRVQRRDASNSEVSAQNFDIVFETKDTPKKAPVACPGNYIGCSSSIYPNTTSQDDPLNSQTGWATHPAFTWWNEELNGFWIGKFETTGSTSQPTVLPNQKHIGSSLYIGGYYDVAKSMGVSGPNNNYGNGTSIKQNNNNLAISTSHMLKNSEWGAVAYLSASKYGAGVNKVQINGNYASGSDDNGDSSRSVTGCGPQANGDENDYSTVGTIGTSTACGSVDKAYNGTLGQKASTTNNIYGVYDMSGGAWEYVMGNYSTLSQSSGNTSYMKTAVKPPYVDIYNIASNDNCTWNTSGSGCGGHALFETASWGGDYSSFVDSSYPWFIRGGYAGNGSDAGLFYSAYNSGYTGGDNGFRVALLPPPQEV